MNNTILNNPAPSGEVAVWAIGGAILAGTAVYLLSRPKTAAAAEPGRTICKLTEVEPAKLHVFAQSKGLFGVTGVQIVGSPGVPPTWEQYIKIVPADGKDADGKPTWTPPLLVLSDLSFWTYGGSPLAPQRRDDLALEYCTFSQGQFTPVSGHPASAFLP